MQNIHEILSGIGIEVPENKKADFEKALRENYKTVAEVGKIEAARDSYKEQLGTAQTQLKAFEGVDVNDLRGQISALTKTIDDNNAAFAAKLADMDFNEMLEGEIKKANAKSVKAVMGMLDVQKLKESKNRQTDIAAAIADVQKENDFLFDSGTPAPTISVPGNPALSRSEAKGYMDSFYKNNPFYKN